MEKMMFYESKRLILDENNGNGLQSFVALTQRMTQNESDSR